MKQTKQFYLNAIYDSAKSFYNKAVVVENGNTKTLKSYNTNILTLDTTTNEIVWMTKNINHFTMTTNRHINEFLKQFCGLNESLTKKEIIKIATF